MKTVITKEITANGTDGLIKYIGQNNYLKHNTFISSSYIHVGNKETFFHWGEEFQLVNDTNSVFLNYSFDTFSLSLTHYTIKARNNSCYAKTWELYGINKEETRIIHKGDASSMCSLDQEICDTSHIEKFAIDPNSSKIAFSSFLFTSTNGSCPSHGNHFAGAGLEFFGTLYAIQQCITLSYKLNKVFPPFLFISVFLM